MRKRTIGFILALIVAACAGHVYGPASARAKVCASEEVSAGGTLGPLTANELQDGWYGRGWTAYVWPFYGTFAVPHRAMTITKIAIHYNNGFLGDMVIRVIDIHGATLATVTWHDAGDGVGVLYLSTPLALAEGQAVALRGDGGVNGGWAPNSGPSALSAMLAE